MRNKIRWWLIILANFIGTKEHHDLGEPIVGLVTLGKKLFVATKGSLYLYKDKKYTRISVEKDE